MSPEWLFRTYPERRGQDTPRWLPYVRPFLVGARHLNAAK